MTSIAVNSSAAAPQNTTNASTSSSIGSTRSPTSGQSASATVQTSAPAPRASYATAAQSARKAPSGPGGNAASSSSTAPSQASGGGASGQHARSASTTSVPVNGKSITPAVPTLGNSGNSNGASTTPFSGGQHSRKPSIATMPNGSSRGAPNIKFGAINDSGIGPQTSGSAVAAGNNNLTAPMAQNPRASSPSPAAIQPAASGGGLPPTPGAAKPIQFGDTTPQQRPVQPYPHNPPQGPGSMGRGGGGGAGGHNRHDSAHSESVPHMPHGRGMPQAARGRSLYSQNPYQNAQYGGGGGGNQGGYNVGRGGYQGQSQHQQRNGPANMGSAAPFPAAPFPQQQFPNSPRGVPRSPALSHVTAHQSPSMAPAIPTPQLYPQPHGQPFGSPQVQYMQQMYGDPYYPQNYGMQPYQQFPQTSPRTGYSQPVPSMGGGGFPYTPQQPTPMSRSPSSHNMEIRPASSIGQHGQHGPPHGPHSQMMMSVSPQQPTPVPSQSPHRQAPKSKAITIRDPGTGAPVVPQPTTPVAAVSSSIIVESPSPASGRTPSRSETPNNRSTSRSNKTAEDKRREMREKVMAMAIGSVGDKKTQDAKATEEKKKQEEEAVAAAAIAKDEAEAKAKAEAEAKAKEEQEERAKKEAEEKAKAEAEEKEKAEAEAKAKAEKEAEDQRIKEAVEKEAKEAEEAAAAAKAKEEADAKAKAEAEAAEAEARAKAEAEAEAEAAAESAKAAEAKVEAEKEAPLTPAESPKVSPPDDGESMPPPSLKTAEKSRSKPSPLNFQIPTTDAGLPSAQLTPQLTALRSARPVDNLMGLQYPEGIASPNPALNPLATATKFKYDKDFLMQFQTVFTEKPSPDWDQRMQETVGESEPVRPGGGSARPPSGLGGTRSSSSRGVPMFVGVMGSFTGPASVGSKAASMSSAERFKHSTNAGNPLGAGGFPRTGSNMGRTNSSTSLSGSASGALPQSPRTTGNRSARGNSKRGNTGVAPSMERSDSRQQSSQPTIPLSDVKPLPVSANRWKPGRLKGGDSAAAATPGSGPPGAAAGADGLMSPEMVQRKVKAALNKMTPEKFDKISDQILEITGQSKHESDGRTLRQVIQLTFEKATDEAHWASMYAKFCKRMLETMDSSIKDENIKDKNGVVVTGGNLFRKYLLNRCQEEFERGWKVNLPDQTKAAGEEVTMLSDEYYIAAAAKRRGLGLVQFIGELFKLGMLTERIMNECVRKLLDFEGLPEDETVESLSKLLRTIGGQLDSSEKSSPIMDLYFGRITAMIENKELNSRMRFMLMDIVDLRKRKWESNEKDKGPKTIQEVREEALKAQLEKEAISKANRNRPQPGRGDSRYLGGGGGGGGYQQNHHDNKTSGTLNTDELSRLKNRSGQRSSNTTHFGPVSSLSPRSNSSRRGMQDSGSRTPSAPAPTSSPNMYSALLQDPSQHDGNETASSPPSNNNSPQVSNARPVTEEA